MKFKIYEDLMEFKNYDDLSEKDKKNPLLRLLVDFCSNADCLKNKKSSIRN